MFFSLLGLILVYLTGCTGLIHPVPSSGVRGLAQKSSPPAPASSLGIVDVVPFAQRCAAPGVFRCIGFDSPGDFVTSGDFPAQTVYNAGNDIGQDCTVSASGGCSLRITVPGPNNPGATDASKFEWDFVKDNQAFGQNSTLYVQVRFRLDHALLKNDYHGEGWKQVLIYGGKTSCSNLGLVTQNEYYRGYPIMFHRCSPNISTTVGDTIYLEQGDYNCAYGSSSAKHCALYHGNEWDTYYWKIHVGNWGQANSSVEAWVAYGEGPLRKWVYQPHFTLQFQESAGDVLDKIALTAYITGRRTTDLAPSDGHMWFDELILSSQPIPAPNGPTP